jgi:putative membrane protein
MPHISPRRARLSLALALGCGVLAACEERAGDLPILEQTPPYASDVVAPRTHVLTEAQAVDVLSALNHGEISLARYALERATTPDARQFAQMMIDGHTEAQANVEAWAQGASVLGAPNDVTPTLQNDARDVRTRLESTDDAHFDEAYVQSQVDMHQRALDLIDQRVVPGARDQGFRRLVATLRTGVATHLAHARALAEGPAGGRPLAAR